MPPSIAHRSRKEPVTLRRFRLPSDRSCRSVRRHTGRTKRSANEGGHSPAPAGDRQAAAPATRSSSSFADGHAVAKRRAPQPPDVSFHGRPERARRRATARERARAQLTRAWLDRGDPAHSPAHPAAARCARATDIIANERTPSPRPRRYAIVSHTLEPCAVCWSRQRAPERKRSAPWMAPKHCSMPPTRARGDGGLLPCSRARSGSAAVTATRALVAQDLRLLRAIRRLTFATSLSSTTHPRHVGAPQRQGMAESAGQP